MSRFYTYLHEGGSAGEDMEEAIIASLNGEPHPEGLHSKVTKQGADNIVKFLRSIGVQGKGKVIGASTIEVTKK